MVDNQSADDQLPLFISDFPMFRFIENTGNYGFSNGCNVAASHSTGEFYFFLNPDTVVNIQALEELVNIAESHPEISILSCQQLKDNGKETFPYGLEIHLGTFTGVLRAFYRVTHKRFPIVTLKPSGGQALLPDWVSGSAILISRDKFNILGGWSEDFWMYFEDVDLCKRAKELVGSVVMLTHVNIIHNHGGSSRINLNTKVLTKSEAIISKHVYITKHSYGARKFVMQSYLIFNNLLFGLFPALLGIVLFFKPSVLVYTKLYIEIFRYYFGTIKNKTWLSPRSVNFRHPG